VSRAERAVFNPATSDVLYIALTFDADSDYFDSSLINGELQVPHPLGWRGVEEGIPLIGEVLRTCTDDFESAPRSTWFVRVDGQLATLYGDAGYLLERYGVLWRRCLDQGDEIGWHPHLCKVEDGEWRQETEDMALVEALKEGYGVIRQKGLLPISSRIGEAFCSDVILATLDELGILCDSTAMPGRVRKDGERHLDWEATPQQPYHPSRSDYRQPGLEPLSLLEVPMSMVQIKAEYDDRPLRRYVDLSFRHKALKAGLRSYLRDAKLLVTVTHPCAVLPGITERRHGLLSFDIREFKRNLDFIFSECRRLGRKYKFITIGDCWRLFSDKAGAGSGNNRCCASP